ncbi:MAG: ClpXP protease specificity-enhancing factor SspB, partial [Pseudorhodoplanes sp.]
MTVILQYQFWDLKVTDTGFEVGLSFGGVPETLGVPFAAIKSFFDPSVQFGLQFETIEAEAEASPESQATAPVATLSEIKTAEPSAPESASPAAAASTDRPSGEVVRLDRFRKK